LLKRKKWKDRGKEEFFEIAFLLDFHRNGTFQASLKN
jgi:hypothetical protein